jgi:hypothetical protein
MATIKKNIKKAQKGVKATANNTRVKKPAISKPVEKGTITQTGYRSDGSKSRQFSVDTSGYSKGKESFPGNAQYWQGFENKRTFKTPVNFSKSKVDDMIKNPSVKNLLKSGGKVSVAKGGKWIQAVTKSIKKRGTEGVCTGSKFGGPTCKPGSKRYNLAKTFRKMSKKK